MTCSTRTQESSWKPSEMPEQSGSSWRMALLSEWGAAPREVAMALQYHFSNLTRSYGRK